LYPVGTTIHSPQTGETLPFRLSRNWSSGKLFQAELWVQPGDYIVCSRIRPYPEEQPPVWLQKLLVPTIATIARLFGLHVRYEWFNLGKSSSQTPSVIIVAANGYCP